jgi:subfamily B ATP-binding cassette protein MsbA
MDRSYFREIDVARRLWPFTRRYVAMVAVTVALGVGTAIAEAAGIILFIPLFRELSAQRSGPGGANPLAQTFGTVFDALPDDRRIWIICACIFATVAVKAVLTFGYGIAERWLHARVNHDLRAAVFRQLLGVGYGYIQRSRSGMLFSTLTTDCARAGDASALLVKLLVTEFMIAAYVLLLLVISWKLTLVVAAGIVLISWVVVLLVRRTKALGRLLRRADAALSHRMVQGLNGIRVIREFGRETEEEARFEEGSRHVSRLLLKISLLSNTAAPVYDLLVMALMIGILVFSARTPGELPSLVAFILLLYRIQPMYKQLAGTRLEIASRTGAVEHVTALLDPVGKPYVVSGDTPVTALREDIVLDDVSFAYDGERRPALSRVDLRIEAGRTTALVGRSGAGKSTLINLLLRHYDPTGGEIRVDGRPLASLRLSDWRAMIAVVSQDVYLFNASVAENIAYGKKGATREEVVAAAKLAHAHEFIVTLPRGYDTPVGERGLHLSGGQQQRLTLARAVIRDPQILILDEATNALDAISEQLIQEALGSLRHGRTVIVIAHRLSTVEQADRIVVMEDGRAIEQGRPAQLLKDGGRFAQIYELQRRTTIEAGEPAEQP